MHRESIHRFRIGIRALPYLLVLSGLFLIPPDAKATHFRGGVITWQQAGGNNILITFNSSWRRSYPGTPGTGWGYGLPGPNVGQVLNNAGSINFGNGTGTVSPVVTAVDAANDIVYATWTTVRTYAVPGNYLVTFSGNARLSTLQNGNADDPYSLQTIVNVGGPPFNNAPVSSVADIVTLALGQPAATFTLSATDPDNDPLTFRLATATESGLSPSTIPGFSLSTSGVVTFNTVGKIAGQLFAVQAMIEDGRTKAPVDFLIQIVASSAPPTFVAPTPFPPNDVFTVTPPLNSVTFTVAANDPDAGQNVTLQPVSVPVGSTMSPVLPVVGPANGTVSSTFSWTPGVSQVGTYVINFIAQDNVGVQAFRPITIRVLCPLAIVVDNITPASCPSGSNGAISVSVTNASSPGNLSYSWTGPTPYTAATEDISGLAVGVYTLRVDDAGTGCFTTVSIPLGFSDGIAPAPDLPALPDVTGECSATITSAPTATDNCSGVLVGTTSDALSYSTQGTHLVTWTYDDGNGNTTTQTQRVIVDDVTDPVPNALSLSSITAECGATITTVPTATDNCAGSLIGTTTNPLTYSGEGTYVVTWTYDDGNGNTTTQNQTVIIDDVTAPTVVLNSSIALWPPNHEYVTVDIDDMIASISDNCASLSANDAKITSVSSDEPENANGTGDGNTWYDIVIDAGCNSVQLRRERNGTGNGRVYTVHFSVSDGSGNVSSYAFTVTVPHNVNSTAVDDGPAAGYTVTSSCTVSKGFAASSPMSKEYVLEQNYPNPFSGGYYGDARTTISYAIPVDAHVKLTVYDLFGRSVAVLVDGPQKAGSHTAGFNASGLTRGSYVYVLESNGSVISRTMNLLK